MVQWLINRNRCGVCFNFFHVKSSAFEWTYLNVTCSTYFDMLHMVYSKAARGKFCGTTMGCSRYHKVFHLTISIISWKPASLRVWNQNCCYLQRISSSPVNPHHIFPQCSLNCLRHWRSKRQSTAAKWLICQQLQTASEWLVKTVRNALGNNPRFCEKFLKSHTSLAAIWGVGVVTWFFVRWFFSILPQVAVYITMY